ncbi:TetR family transcriptional regulator [Frankia sp. CcI49]|uniref:DNA-binding transcriptional regulator, AcrR family n=1 Tax=Parafrankia irregularis TaxID=795642 RepID=A0A0S4QWX0_9ACTN|nr:MULTISPECIES: TetR/AcrR family transcriptional regulator [Frankiaceae]MBE3202782.1 TetR/AcrR family transcriptional regulator [Parafrankia sp. CH37]ONH50399.1 TetR family transcriptional regulator [Frankia sp. CcI49]CUU60055.1 DNA-binding transcriptional regulator, AcrR family [Parafrankia irregularis]
MTNAIGRPSRVATRIAARTAAERRRPDYTAEVSALIDAARHIIETTGTAGKARVADIVAAAGLSNDAFYRHFPSKDALVAALIEDGAERVAAAIARRMAAEPSAEGRIRVWVEGTLAQTDASQAASTAAVLWNSSTLNSSIPTGDHAAKIPLARLLHEPFASLGSTTPELDAELVTHAVFGRVGGHLRAGTRVTPGEKERLLRFCLSTPLDGRQQA